MRILIVSEDIPHPSTGGLGKHVLTLCKSLRQLGHDVDLLGNDFYDVDINHPEFQFGGRIFRELNGHFIQWKEPTLGAFLPQRRTWVARRFARAIMRHAARYDVIHYHGHFPNVARYIPAHLNFIQTRHDQGSDCLLDVRFRNGQICRETSPQSCAHCRSPNPNAVQKALSTMSVARFRREVAEGFIRHKTVFVSDMLHRNLQRTLGARQWGTVIHHFVDTEAIRYARETAAQTPRTDARFHIVVAGKLYKVKGIEAFLRDAVPLLRPDMRITVVGDGNDGPQLRKEFESKQVHFTGWCTVEKTLELVASADAVIVPSLWEEPFGATTLEGLLLGKPVFALAHGATPEQAAYASAADQLRLHPDMPSLVQDLLKYETRPPYPAQPHGTGGPDRAVQQLLALYSMPPGNAIFTQEKPCPSASR